MATKYRPFHEGEAVWDGEPTDDSVPDYNLSLPPWICQPYYRPAPEEHKQIQEEKQKAALQRGVKHKYFDKEGTPISKKRAKKLKRLETRVANKEVRQEERHGELCTECDNTRGLKCDSNLCRICCRNKCFNDNLNCQGHKLFVKDKREKAKKFEAGLKKKAANDDGAHDMEAESSVVMLMNVSTEH